MQFTYNSDIYLSLDFRDTFFLINTSLRIRYIDFVKTMYTLKLSFVASFKN